jgi:hypothetical protein
MATWHPDGAKSAMSCRGGDTLDRVQPRENILSGGWEGAGALALFDDGAEASGGSPTTVVLSPFLAFIAIGGKFIKCHLH